MAIAMDSELVARTYSPSQAEVEFHFLPCNARLSDRSFSRLEVFENFQKTFASRITSPFVHHHENKESRWSGGWNSQ